MIKRLLLLVVALVAIASIVSGTVYCGATICGNTTSFYNNITWSAGAQTNYQIMIILSNSSGTSGYYAPYNIIYTSKTTRPDWYDINITTSSDTPIPFWIENNTQNATTATLWINMPSIAIDNSSITKIGYGNSTDSTSTANGYNTFLFFDDFITGSRNTTLWNLYGNGAPTYSGGVMTVSSTSSNGGVNSTALYGVNNSYVARGKFSTSSGSFGFADALSDINVAASFGTANYKFATHAGGSYTNSATSADTNYHVLEVDRNSNVNVSFKYDGPVAFISSTNFGTVPEYIRYDVANPATEAQDWAFVKKYVFPEPTTSLYTTVSSGAGTPLSSSFTQSANPSSTGQLVTYTDTSTGSPTTWNWTLGGIITNTTQNAGYIYSTAGVYTVNLTVTNSTGAISHSNQTHTVNNATGFTPQDIYMQGQYAITFLINDADGNLLSGATITDSTGQSNTTGANGVTTLTEPFGTILVTAGASGYYGKTMSYVVDSDASHTLTLTKISATPGQNTWWTPHVVQITVMDLYGGRLYNVNIAATYNESSMPTAWLSQLYGIQGSAASDMINQTLVMQGTTGSDGTITFTMLGSLKYDFTLQSTEYGINVARQLYPSDSMVNFYVTTAGQQLPTGANNTYVSLNGTRTYFTEPNSSYGSMCIDYVDTSGNTAFVNETWWFTNNMSIIQQLNFTPGTTLVTNCYTMQNVKGTSTWWQYSAGRTV